MKPNFFLYMSIIFWIIMMVGFSDNWLYKIDQESNSNPIFVIHGLLAFAWFTVLVIQTGFIQKRKIRFHQNLGIATMAIFPLFVLSSFAIYIDMYISKGEIDANGLGLLILFLFAVFIIILAFRNRKLDIEKHKMLMLFGSFLMLRPAIDRVYNKVLDILPPLAIFALYFLTFLVFYFIFYKYKNKFEWYLGVGFLLWFLGVMYGYLL